MTITTATDELRLLRRENEELRSALRATAAGALAAAGAPCEEPVVGVAGRTGVRPVAVQLADLRADLAKLREEIAHTVRTTRLQVVDENERVVAEIEGPHVWLRHSATDGGCAHLGVYTDEAEMTLVSNERVHEGPDVAHVRLHAGNTRSDGPGATLNLDHGGAESGLDATGTIGPAI